MYRISYISATLKFLIYRLLYSFSLYKPLVTIVIPFFNREKTLKNSIFSILNQSYTNLEIILVDDASTDDSLNIAKQDKRVFLIKNQDNIGCYRSINKAIKYMSGVYFTIHGSDDISHRNRVEYQLLPLLYSKNIYATSCNFVRIISGIKKKSKLLALMIKKTTINNIGLYDKNRFGCDEEMYLRIKRIYGKRSVFHINKILYEAYQSKNSLTKRYSFNDRELYINKYRKLVKK